MQRERLEMKAAGSSKNYSRQTWGWTPTIHRTSVPPSLSITNHRPTYLSLLWTI